MGKASLGILLMPLPSRAGSHPNPSNSTSEVNPCTGITHPLSPAQIQNYFTLDLDLPSLLQPQISSDAHLLSAMQKYPGLRPLREDPWECLANFICSSLKQIVQIRQIHARMRQTFGGPANTFPSAETLAQAGESALRSCALGYRARHLLATAKRVASQPSLLEIPPSLPTSQPATPSKSLPGVARSGVDIDWDKLGFGLTETAFMYRATKPRGAGEVRVLQPHRHRRREEDVPY